MQVKGPEKLPELSQCPSMPAHTTQLPEGPEWQKFKDVSYKGMAVRWVIMIPSGKQRIHLQKHSPGQARGTGKACGKVATAVIDQCTQN